MAHPAGGHGNDNEPKHPRQRCFLRSLARGDRRAERQRERGLSAAPRPAARQPSRRTAGSHGGDRRGASDGGAARLASTSCSRSPPPPPPAPRRPPPSPPQRSALGPSLSPVGRGEGRHRASPLPSGRGTG